jgi:hypothetical protein
VVAVAGQALLVAVAHLMQVAQVETGLTLITLLIMQAAVEVRLVAVVPVELAVAELEGLAARVATEVLILAAAAAAVQIPLLVELAALAL